MCGIVGYLGNKENCLDFLINGLKELEYRGYDSAGISLKSLTSSNLIKSVGKISILEEKISKNIIENNNYIGIGHTRWATHGKVTEVNSHPHISSNTQVVHNGIIENYKELKDMLIKKGFIFKSETDTEVIPHLFEYNLQNNVEDLYSAFEETIKLLEGNFSILLTSDINKDKIFFCKKGSPLILGINENEKFFASSDTPLINNAKEVVYLEDGSYGFISSSEIVCNLDLDWNELPLSKTSTTKGEYSTYLEKEIYEQQIVVLDTLKYRIIDNKVFFKEIDNNLLEDINEITISACGTSYHSALVASYLFERLAKIKCNVEVASEFIYREPILNKNSLFIVISQSGETSDTLKSLEIAKDKGLKTLSICNVDNSSITRLADINLQTKAGVEKSVASTKAFTTQTVVLWLLSLFIGQEKKSISEDTLSEELKALKLISNSLHIPSKVHEKCKKLSKRYLNAHGFFFIGRDVFYPLALEGALKLKEISYLHAEGYPSGEMKHGPIALADSDLITIALAPKNKLYDKIKSNIEELSARDSTICLISNQYLDICDDFIRIRETNHYMLEFFEMLIVIQLLSLEISLKLGNNIDMPRNLAKSVTVE